VRGEGERRLTRLELRVLAAVVEEAPTLAERALVEVEAGGDV
jgi:hypothetical protein